MKKLLLLILLFVQFFTNAQTMQSLVDTKDLSVTNRIFFDGAWRYRWLINSDIKGGIVTWVSGFTFAVTSAQYTIKGKEYSSAGGQITLNAADSIYPRFDVIALNNLGQIVKLTGTPAALPSVPVTDRSTQIFRTLILVPAAATSPGGVSNITIYNENTEWSHVDADFTGGINYTSTTQPYTGAVSINVTGTTGTTASGGFKFFNGQSFGYKSFTTLRFYIRLKAALTSGANLQVGLGNGNETLTPITAAHGFNPALINVWQNVTMPIEDFNKLSTNFSVFYFIITGNASGFYVDNIQLQNGVTTGNGGNLYDTLKVNSPLKVFYNGTTGEQRLGSDTVNLTKDGILKKEDYATFLAGGSGGGQTPILQPVNYNYYRIDSLGGVTVRTKTGTPATNTYATWNPGDKYLMTLTAGNLTAAKDVGGNSIVRSTVSVSSGKYYWEVLVSTATTITAVGVCKSTANIYDIPGLNTASYGYWNNGVVYGNGTDLGGTPATYTNGDRIGIAIDVDAGTVKFFKNNVLQLTATGLTAGNYFAVFGGQDNAPLSVATANFGASSLTYTPPATYNPGLYTSSGVGVVRTDQFKADSNGIKMPNLSTAPGTKTLRIDADGNVTKTDTTVVNNIYTSDGTLAGTRTINNAGFNTIWSGSGKFGIGSTPFYKLHVQENAAGIFSAFITNNSSTGAGLGINTFATGGTIPVLQVLAGATGSTSLFEIRPAGAVLFNNNAGTSGQVLTSAGPSAPPTWTTSSSSGTYTPTLTNVANITASTAYSCQYTRVGNMVTVSGKVDIDPMLTATLTDLRISLPIASALVNDNELAGTGVAGAIAGYSASVLGDATNDAAILRFMGSDINNNSWYFTFLYRVL